MLSWSIELENISKIYTEKKNKVTVAIEGLSMCVPCGAIVSLMGGSGCGKSTITKIVSGIEDFNAGTLRINGQKIESGAFPLEIRRRIGYVFQWNNLAEWRTVEDNLYLPLEMFNKKKELYWRERAIKYIDFVGLKKYLDVYPRELSGGMCQRVGIARALMAEPDILVFDQPLGALDAITRGMLAAQLNRLIRDEKKTLLMVTSNIEEAVRYSDMIYVMSTRPGRIKHCMEIGISEEERTREDFLFSDKFIEKKKQLTNLIYG